jgi:hypothetical protein
MRNFSIEDKAELVNVLQSCHAPFLNISSRIESNSSFHAHSVREGPPLTGASFFGLPCFYALDVFWVHWMFSVAFCMHRLFRRSERVLCCV